MRSQKKDSIPGSIYPSQTWKGGKGKPKYRLTFQKFSDAQMETTNFDSGTQTDRLLSVFHVFGPNGSVVTIQTVVLLDRTKMWKDISIL